MPPARVLILGDSHRLAYQRAVGEILAVDGLTVVGPPDSTGDARTLAESVAGFIEAFEPDVACFACGAHAAEMTVDAAATEPDRGTYAEYGADLERIGQALQRFCGRQVLYVTTLPVDPDRLGGAIAGGRGAEGIHEARLFQRRLDQYNHLASETMARLNIMVADPARELAPHVEEAIADDGWSLTGPGARRVAESVAAGVYAVL